MTDENLIEELREYLKDHYTPVNDSVEVGSASFDKEELQNDSNDSERMKCCVSPFVGLYHVYSSDRAAVNIKKALFRNISDDASEYIKKNRKPGGFAYALDQKRKEKGLTPSELYKRANVDRRQYSRLMGPEGRHPSKNTVISFALALRLNRGEFDEFLKTAGYSLTNTSSRDVCIMFCIEKGHYDIDKANAVLFAVGIEPLSRDSNS